METSRSALTRYEDFLGMLSDSVRLTAYEKAIRQCVRKGDVVVDLGAGTGILGFLALKAGAKKVFLIEKGDSLDLARAVAAQNGLSQKTTFCQANSKEVTLPEKADVIVSETLGSFGVDENTLEFMVDARNRFLKPGGILIPARLDLFLAPVESQAIRDKIDFWKNIQGLDYSPAREVFGRKLMVETIEPDQLLGEPRAWDTIDFLQEQRLHISNKALFPFQRKGRVHGMGGWFDLHLTDEVHLSTAPGQPATHWKQAFLPILEQVQVIKGDIMEWTMSIRPQENASDNTIIDYQYRCSQLARDNPATGQAVGRNDPCPCGSGRKFKKCCGNNEASP